jgi:acetylornithine deacetylase/succinyl-diaminopimelate desuccinylase-like protein
MSPAQLEELYDLLRIPSVSADAAHAADVRRAGEWVRDLVRTAGEAELVETKKQPLVIGEIRASRDPENAPTVLVYGHFDVQPPAPLQLWESDPFTLTFRDEWAYARGIADDKGQLYILLKAAQRLVEANALPVNLRFACDGEEEVGGTTIVDWIGIDTVGANAAVIFDGGMVKRDVPVFDLGTRGLVAFEVKVKTGERDLHSGMYGGAALNAIHVLMRIFSSVLAGPDGRLPEPLRQGIAPVAAEELEAWSTLPDPAEDMRTQGARALDDRAIEEFYVRTWAEPSVDVNGIIGGKPGLRNTTLSVHASGEFTIRLAPGQDPNVIGAAAEQLLRHAAPAGADLDVAWEGTPPSLFKPDAPAIQLGLGAFEKVLGVRPKLVRSGGTLPIMPALADKGIATVLTGFALPESNVHSPNERFLVEYFDKGVAAAAELYTAYGALPPT